MSYKQKSSGSELTGNGDGDKSKKSLSAFQKAFKEARANEQDQFKFKGKTYHTGTKEELETGTGYFSEHNIHGRNTVGLREEQYARIDLYKNK